MDRAEAIVVGAGLAGLSCAVALADEGLRVVVLEAAAEPGGRARSWTHAPTQDVVDIGPHVVHSEYDNFLAFLGRLGTRHLITWQPKKLITIASHPPTISSIRTCIASPWRSPARSRAARKSGRAHALAFPA